jgi:outer membrane protein assembly factor BamA
MLHPRCIVAANTLNRFRSMNLLFLKHGSFAFTVLLLMFSSVNADTLLRPSEDSLEYFRNDTIAAINYVGNRITKPQVIKMYLGVDTGAVFDSVLVAEGEKKLLDTDLFSSIKVLHLHKKDGIHLFIIVKELFYLYPEGTGYYSRGIYGDTNTLWWKLRLGLTLYNFRGLLETFSIRGSFWEERGIGISWSKPFLPSPYAAGISFDYNDAPDLGQPIRIKSAGARISSSTKLPFNSRVYGALGTTYSMIDTLRGQTIKSFMESGFVVGFATDHRDRSFDPRRGWSFLTQANTNALYSQYLKYLQMYGEIKVYHRGIFDNNIMAYKLQTVLRSNDAGSYRKLYMGGESNVKGYSANYFGRKSTMNDYVAFSAEYRFPIWTTPTFDTWILSFLGDGFKNIPILSNVNDILKDFYLRVDGAVMGNVGHIWHDIDHPFQIRENGGGAGTGIRIVAPTLRRSGCIDFVWNIPGTSDPYGSRFYRIPAIYLYLDMYF